MLTAEQRRLREYKITASMSPTIMSGDAKALNKLFEECVGQREPEDLSDVWPVQFGSHIEPFGLDWHQRKTGQPLIERGRVVDHPTLPRICCTLDAYRAIDDCVIDHKACNGWLKLDDIRKLYTPQIIMQMRCRQASRGVLLVLHGGQEVQEVEVLVDADYEAGMWKRILDFQRCVETLTPPVPMPPIMPPEQWRKIDLDDPAQTPNWGEAMKAALVEWGTTKDQAARHDVAIAEIKLLLPEDTGLLTHGEFHINRNRRGAVSITRGH